MVSPCRAGFRAKSQWRSNLFILLAEVLSLSGSASIGSIPSEMGRLTLLNTLDLSIGRLTGEIPSEMGNMTTLRSMKLDVNFLEGTIPTEIGNLANNLSK